MVFIPDSPLPPVRATGDVVPVANDINLLRAAILEWLTAGLLTAQDGDGRYPTTSAPLRFRPAPTMPADLASEDVWIDTSGNAAGDYSFTEFWRTSECATLPAIFTDTATGTSLSAGTVLAARAKVVTAQTFTKMKASFFAVGTAVTNARMGIFDLDGTPLAWTVDFASSLTTTGAKEVALETPWVGLESQEVFLGIGLTTATGSYQVVRRSAGTAAFNTDKPRTWTGPAGTLAGTAAPIALTGTTRGGTVPWIELTV